MPPNTIYVGRPTKWGNPYRVGERLHGYGILDLETALKLYELYAVNTFKQKEFNEIKGKNLACWCPLGQRCHADILLELAN